MAQEQLAFQKPPLRPPCGSLALQALGASRGFSGQGAVRADSDEPVPAPPPARAETQKSWGSFFRKGFGKVQKVLQVGQLPAWPVLS